jgi:hypothetical protein
MAGGAAVYAVAAAVGDVARHLEPAEGPVELGRPPDSEALTDITIIPALSP